MALELEERVLAVDSGFFSLIDAKRYSHIPLDELYRMLRVGVKSVDVVRVDPRKAVGMVLAEDLYAEFDRPEKDISHVDGFAIRSQDVVSTSAFFPVKLKIVEGVNSREADKYALKRGEAVFVETGYPLPVNADAVIPVEAVRIEENYVIVDKPVYKHYQVFPRGSDYTAGELVAKRGTRVTPILAKLLIDMGFSEIHVYRKPRVAVYSIGDELRDEPYKPGAGFIPASTAYVDLEVIEYYGGEVVETAILPDNPKVIAETVAEALNKVDVVVTIGGVAMGPRDYSWLAIIESIGAEAWWRGVKMLPGRATSGFIVKGKAVINQPGLPLSSIPVLMLVITPVLNYMQGLELKPSLTCFEVVLENDIYIPSFIDHYRIALLNVNLSEMKARFLEVKGSYYLKPVVSSNAVTILEPGIERIRRESYVTACFYPPIFMPMEGVAPFFR